MLTPATLLGAPKLQLFDNDGNPATGYFLFTYVAGTSTPANTYSDALLTIANANPVVLDAAGRATIYLQPSIGYKFVLQTPALVTVWTQDNVNDLSTLLFSYLISTGGSKGVSSGYSLISTDLLVTVNSTGTNPSIINLPAASTRFNPIRIKNIGPNPISVVAAGADTIEGSTLTTIGIPGAASPMFPTMTLQSDQSSIWWVFDSTGGVISGGGSGNGGASIFTKIVPLSNAQIKGLPTTPVTIVSAPGSGKRVKVVSASLVLDTSASAYGAVNATYCAVTLSYTDKTGPWAGIILLNDSTTTPAMDRATAALTATRIGVIDIPVPYADLIGADWWVALPPAVQPSSDFDNKALVICADNNAAVDFNGGNAANTGLLVVTYTIEDLS